MQTKTFIVPHDFTAVADIALQHAIATAKPLGAQIQVLHVVSKDTQIPEAPVKPVSVPADGIVRESKKSRKEPDPHSIRVFDLDKNEWRSFRFERLRKVSAEIVFG